MSFFDFSTEELEKLQALISRAQAGDTAESKPGIQMPIVHEASRLTRLARRLKSVRNQRASYFDPSLFGEPAWDILLTLFISWTEGYRLTVTEVAEASNAPLTTGLRWITVLESAGLARRERHNFDARSYFVELTDTGGQKMNAMLEEVLSKYIPEP